MFFSILVSNVRITIVALIYMSKSTYLSFHQSEESLFFFSFLFNGEDRGIYLCKQKTKKKLSLNTGVTRWAVAAKH